MIKKYRKFSQAMPSNDYLILIEIGMNNLLQNIIKFQIKKSKLFAQIN